MTRYITTTAMIAMLMALWLVAATAGPNRLHIQARSFTPSAKVVALVRDFHRVLLRSAYKAFEPALKIARPTVDCPVAQTTTFCRQHETTLQEPAR